MTSPSCQIRLKTRKIQVSISTFKLDTFKAFLQLANFKQACLEMRWIGQYSKFVDSIDIQCSPIKKINTKDFQFSLTLKLYLALIKPLCATDILEAGG